MTLQLQGISSLPSNITRDDPPITRDYPSSLLILQGTTLQLQGITLPPSLLTSQGRSLTDGALVGLVECPAGVGLVDVGAVALLPDATVGLEFGEAAACRAALGAKVGEAVGVAECSLHQQQH